MNAKVEKWLDEVKMAALGIVLSSRTVRFWTIFLSIFVVFGTLLSLLAGGMAAFNLFFSTDFGGKMEILRDGFLGFLGKDKNFWDFLQNLIISLLQALLIALIVVVYKKRKQNEKYHRRNDNKQKRDKNKQRRFNFKHKLTKNATVSSLDDTEAVQNAGIAAGLAILGCGCPTCGTTLITPILVSMFSASGYAIASTVSYIVTILAVILLLWSLKRVGVEAYAIIIDERWRKKRQKVEENESN